MQAGCADPAAPGSDAVVPVSWMEWPGAVTADQPGSIRITGFHGICGTFRVEVRQSAPSTISVDAALHFTTASPQACPATIVIFDTILPLPRLSVPAGGNNAFAVDAPVFDQAGTIFRRPFGYLSFSTNQPDATLHAGGQAFVLPDSVGCSWIRPQVPFNEPPHVLSTDVALAPNVWHGAFAVGMYAPALPPRCGQNPLFQAATLEVIP
jgi:hypothetical protein